MKIFFILFVTIFFSSLACAQDKITDAFEDLKRSGNVSEKDSEMRIKMSNADIDKLLQEKPLEQFFYFTEDRFHDIRMTDALPARWANRTSADRARFEGECAPGEFYTWQIGVYAPFKDIEDLSISFSDLKSSDGKTISKNAFQCINLDGTDAEGISFHRKASIGKDKVQALWMGMDIPQSASGTYTGKAYLKAGNTSAVEVAIELEIKGQVIADHGENEGWRKSRLRWLNSDLGSADQPTAPYMAVKTTNKRVSYLGGYIELASTGFPKQIATRYNQSNQLDENSANAILSGEITFEIETDKGIETLRASDFKFIAKSDVSISWQSKLRSKNFNITCVGKLEFDGSVKYTVQTTSTADVQVKDIRLNVPYTQYASQYMMGLGHKGGLRPDSLIAWHWDTDKHQDKVWLGNVNAGLNLKFMDENYKRPLVNVYYNLGKLNMPKSWGNDAKGGIRINPVQNETVCVEAFSGARNVKKGETLHYNIEMLITPVKPLDLAHHAIERFYHSNSDLSENYIAEAEKAGATMINIHHKKDIYPFINYPYSDESVGDFKRFIEDAHKKNIGVRAYYTTRELTIKIPELWAFRSLGGEVIYDGPGKDARTLIHKDGPNKWLNENLATNFIPAWYNAFNAGKYKGDMDISVITTPDSRWNNYYLAGLDWMIRNIKLDGVYIDDSALDSRTLQRARRILDTDGKRRLIDIHSWNHMNQWAGYANSLHIYLDLLPYVDRIWIGEGFKASYPKDFWLVEMSGVPFGLMSESLDARNIFKGMAYGMLPRLPWSGNPVPMWKLWDEFGMKDARMLGYWDDKCPVTTDNDSLSATVYAKGDKALVVVANWTEVVQKGKFVVEKDLLGFTPSKATLPQIQNIQWEGNINIAHTYDIPANGGLIILLEK